GGLFSRLVILIAQGIPGKLGLLIKRHPIAFALACGLAVAVCGFASGGTVYGTGYAQVKHALESGAPLPESFGVLKLLATLLSTASGMPGGIFSPSLAVGAG